MTGSSGSSAAARYSFPWYTSSNRRRPSLGGTGEASSGVEEPRDDLVELIGSLRLRRVPGALDDRQGGAGNVPVRAPGRRDREQRIVGFPDQQEREADLGKLRRKVGGTQAVQTCQRPH